MSAVLDKIAFLACADLSAAEVALRGIPNDDPGGTFIPHVLEKIQAGEYRFGHIVHMGVKVGLTVFAVLDHGDVREFVSVATNCPRTRGIRYDVEKVLEGIARQEGCQIMRMSTVLAGLVKDALAIGWDVREVILQKKIA